MEQSNSWGNAGRSGQAHSAAPAHRLALRDEDVYFSSHPPVTRQASLLLTSVGRASYLTEVLENSSKGHIYATSSGLFKLTLPLIPTHPVSSAEGPTSSAAPPETAQHWDKNSSEDTGDSEQVNFLLHPRQPLSYLSGLISAETAHTHSPSSPPESSTTAMVAQSVTFHGCGDLASQRWSSATELGDFVRDSSKTSEFVIRLTPSKASSEGDEGQRREIKVQVPSFEERTWHLRHRLRTVSGEMEGLLKIKSECDRLARAGAKRFAVGG